jgi:hypothetical protein
MKHREIKKSISGFHYEANLMLEGMANKLMELEIAELKDAIKNTQGKKKYGQRFVHCRVELMRDTHEYEFDVKNTGMPIQNTHAFALLNKMSLLLADFDDALGGIGAWG